MTLLQSLACSVLFSLSLYGGPVRVSFLADGVALQDTLQMLKDAGCSDEARRSFGKAVENYYKPAFRFDRGRFPASSNGFYSFDSPTRLLSALPHKLSDTEHDLDLNCFDLAILLAGGQLRTSVASTQRSGPFYTVHQVSPTRMVWTATATTAEAFDLLYPKSYQDQTKGLFPKSLQDARITLNGVLFQMHYFSATNEQTLRESLLTTLQERWGSCAVGFPERFQLVLVHQVDLSKGYAVTAHAGLLFPRKKGYTYLEKSALSGPFVRLDIDEKEVLHMWFTGTCKGAPKSGWTHHFATFNDSEIRMFTVPE